VFTGPTQTIGLEKKGLKRMSTFVSSKSRCSESLVRTYSALPNVVTGSYLHTVDYKVRGMGSDDRERQELILMVAWQAGAISGGKARGMTGQDIITQRERLASVLDEALRLVDDFNQTKDTRIPRVDVDTGVDGDQ
jgi:hypothetical protein